MAICNFNYCNWTVVLLHLFRGFSDQFLTAKKKCCCVLCVHQSWYPPFARLIANLTNFRPWMQSKKLLPTSILYLSQTLKCFLQILSHVSSSSNFIVAPQCLTEGFKSRWRMLPTKPPEQQIPERSWGTSVGRCTLNDSNLWSHSKLISNWNPIWRHRLK